MLLKVQKIGFENLRRQAISYAALGIMINAAGFLLYIVLVDAAGLPPIASISIIYLTACTCNYFGNRAWTFRDRSQVSRSAPRYFAIQVIGYLANLGIMGLLYGKLGLPHASVQFFAIIVVAPLLFLLSKYVVFHAGQ